MEKKIDFQINLNYFSAEEFNQPGAPESWRKMDLNLLMILDNMRAYSEIPYKITSAYRSPEYNKKLKNSSPNSSHCKGRAVDIYAPDSKTKYLIVKAALHYGISRIGIMDKAVHIDIDDIEKPDKVIWTYY